MKNFDFKQFGIAHGEKIVLGVIGLLVLVALGRTTWKTFDKKPEKVVEQATKADKFIQANPWPEEHQQKYSADNRLVGQIEEMLKPAPGSTWRAREGGGLALSIQPSYALYLKEKLLEKPVILPVNELLASSGVLVGAEIVSAEQGTTGEDGAGGYNPYTGGSGMPTTKPNFKKPTKKGDFRSGRSGKKGTNGMGPMGMGPMGMGNDAGSGGPSYRPPTSPTSGAGPGAGATVGDPMGMGGGMGTGADGGSGSYAAVKSKGVRFVSVRGVFPIKKQLEEYERALNLLKGYYAGDPRQIVQIFGFTVERQVSADGGATWTKWEEVDKDRNFKQLTELNWETDIVAPGVRHPEITAPLLERLYREWGDEATHPRIANYKLSKAAREAQKKLDEEMAKRKESEAAKKKLAKSSGYSRIRRDYNGEARGLLGSAGGAGDGGMYQPPGYPMAGTGGSSASQGFEQGLRDRFESGEAYNKFKKEITAAGDLILFRYFDFDVLPGLTYRYRVRLKMRNPLFEQPAEKVKLDAQKSISQEFVDTPYSNVTDATTVAPDTHLFLARVHQQISASMQEPRASLQIYKWLPELGTIVKGELKELRVGNFVGGVDKKTTRLDPGREEMLVNARTEFNTKSVVLDIMGGSKTLDRTQKADLGLPADVKNTRLFDEVIVIDETGRLKNLNPYSNLAKKNSLDRHLAARGKFYEGEGWKVDENDRDTGDGTGNGDANNAFGASGMPGYDGGDGGMGTRRGRRGRGRNLSGQGRRGGGAGYSPYGGSGGGYTPYGKDGKPGSGRSNRRRGRGRGAAPDCGDE